MASIVPASAVPAAPTSAPAPTQASAQPEGEEKEKKVKVAKGQEFLRKAKTEPYADDTDLYTPQIPRKKAIKYWEKMQAQKARRVPPRSFYSYFDFLDAGDPDAATFPVLLRTVLNIVTSTFWDYLYVFLFIIFLLLQVFIHDGYSIFLAPAALQQEYLKAYNASGNGTAVSPPPTKLEVELAGAAAIGLTPTTMLLPLVFMFLVQLVPTLGMMYLISRCNDMVRFYSRNAMNRWAYTSALVAQCIEFWFYGGRDRSHKAGKVQLPVQTKKEKTTGPRFGLSLFSSNKTHAIDEENQASEYDTDDSEERRAFDEDSSDEDVASRITKAHEEACRQAEEKGEEPPELPPEEVSVLQQIRNERKAAEEAKRLEAKEKTAAAEAACRHWTEWTCLVCNKFNRRPTHPVQEVDVRFGVAGAIYKRTYAILVQSRDAPQCTHCLTYSDYVPPRSSAHWFKYNKKPHDVYTNYPYPVRVQAGLSNNRYSRWARSCWSCLFGVENDSRSKLVFNDWILRQYLNGVFPEPPRQVKPADELYEFGEMVECKLQKGYWTRCRIIAARSNHTYDIKYDSGDELRLVLEENLRLPPEKRTYAYRVEMMMIVLVLFFPLGIVAAFVQMPGAVFLGPLLVALVLLPIRLYRTYTTLRAYHYAGCAPIFRLALFFFLPLFMLLLASVLPVLGASWTTTAILFTIAKLSSFPVLYVQKPNFAMFALALFLQTSAGMYLLGSFLDGRPVGKMIAIAIAPLITASCTVIYYRANLCLVWDVQLKIRPPVNFVADHRTFIERLEDWLDFKLT